MKRLLTGLEWFAIGCVAALVLLAITGREPSLEAGVMILGNGAFVGVLAIALTFIPKGKS